MDNPLYAPNTPTARVVLPCEANRLDATIDFFKDELGFRLEMIFPADSPSVAVLSGRGTSLELRPGGGNGSSGEIRLLYPGEPPSDKPLLAPNGTKVWMVRADPPLHLPELVPSWGITRLEGASFSVGRAGMRYRDLIPDRQGGRFIASHIQVPDGGPLPDYVHYHKIRFQMIYVYKGWVRLVYEDQGPPFEMRAGDCVLQPPEIRHRVLECSDGFEVVELGSPAEHQTLVEHRFDLPTDEIRPERDFGGQRYVLHHAAKATWKPWRAPELQYRDTGIGLGTSGLAGVRVVRTANGGGQTIELPELSDAELQFLFMLNGSCSLAIDGESHPVGPGDAVVLPVDRRVALAGCSSDMEFLDVTLPE